VAAGNVPGNAAAADGAAVERGRYRAYISGILSLLLVDITERIAYSSHNLPKGSGEGSH